MATKLFHFEVYLPNVLASKDGSKRVKLVDERFTGGRLKYSHHALSAAADDRYGSFTHLLPVYFDVARATLIEVEVDFDNWVVNKRVYRQRLDDERDLILVIMPNWVVKTVWINLRSDAHRTLDESKYQPRPKVRAA